MSKDRKERKANVIEVLNKARSMELYAVHQYMNQHYSLDSLDYGELAANMKLIAIDEILEEKRVRHINSFIKDHPEALYFTSGANNIIYKEKQP